MMQGLYRSSSNRLNCGNSFQILFELSEEPSWTLFEKKWPAFCRSVPYLRGRPARAWNLAPYWAMETAPSEPSGHVPVRQAASKEDAYRILDEDLAGPFEDGRWPVRVSAVRTSEIHYVSFLFDHRLFDARGAELFLQTFHDFSLGLRVQTSMPPSLSGLDGFDRQFWAGKQLNRERLALRKKNILTLEADSQKSRAVNCFQQTTLSETQTRAVFERAEKQSGPFMFLPYSLAAACRAFCPLLESRQKIAGDFRISVTRDMRPDSSRVFFNQLSFLFFDAGASETLDLAALRENFKKQFYQAIRGKKAEILADASMLMRILPREILARLMERQKITFSFAALAPSAYAHARLLGARIENVLHRPRIPPRPGAGFFLSTYRTKLNVVFSYLDSLCREDEARSTLERFVEAL